MKRKILRGTTSKTEKIFLQDSSKTDGSGLTGLTNASSGLTCYYIREGDASETAISLSGGTVGTWSSGGFKEVSATNLPGVYELGLPNATLSSGNSTLVMLKGATNLAPTLLEIELDAVNYQSATAFITGVNSLAPPTNWNLDSIDSSGRRLLQPTQTGVTIPTVTALTNAPADSAGVGTLLTRVPNTLPSFPSNFAAFFIDASGRVDVGRILGTASAGAAGTVALDTAQALPASPTAGTTGAALFYGAQQIGRTGTAQAGGANTITLDSGASAVDNIYASHEVKITSGTGSGQFATITGYVGSTKVATITRPGTGNWSTNPDATSVFLILPVPYVTVQASLDKTAYSLSSPQTFNLTGNVTGNLSGSVGSVTGAVGSVTGAVTAGTVSDKTGYALTTAEHTAISGTDVPAALTAQGYTTTRAGYLDTLNGLVAAIWASATRSLTTFGTLTTDAAASVWAATTRTLTTVADSTGVGTLLSRLTAGRATNLDNLDAAVSSRMATFTYTTPPTTGQIAAAVPTTAQIAGAILTTPANLLTTDATGKVGANNLPADYQQRGVAVTLPTPPPTGYGASGSIAVYGDAGAIAYTYTVYDVGGVTPLPGAAVYVSADSAGTQRSQSKITDSLGRVTFQLDAGTAFFWASHPDRLFSNPVSEVVGP